jgi:hypothetical protein
VTPEVIAIDDLISASTSTVLTLAYARALRSAKTLTDTAFIFLVSDYVLADGALGNLLARIDAGASAVLTANLSAVSETAMPALAGRASGDTLTIAPRELMRLALDNLHPLMAAGLAGGGDRHDPDANRVFWRAENDALLGRHYLLHMAAIRPEVSDFLVAAPSDYALVGELAPSGRVEIITDSDEYAVIEVVPEESGVASLARGTLSPATVAGSVRRWATASQRAHANTPIIFHAGNLPNLDATVSDSARFVADVAARLTADPLPVRHHPYWIGQLEHHRRTLIDPAGAAAIPSLLGYDPASQSAGRYRAGELRSRLLGYMPDVRPWHPRWPDVVALRGVLREGAGRALIAGDQPAALRQLMPEATVLSLTELEAADGERGIHDRGVLVLGDLAMARREILTARMWSLLGPTATLAVSTGDIFSDDVAVTSASPDHGRGVAVGPVRLSVQSAMMRMAVSAGRKNGVELAVVLPALAALALASLVLNLAAVSFPARRGAPCSSATAVLRNRRLEAIGPQDPVAKRPSELPPGSATPLLQGGPAQ